MPAHGADAQTPMRLRSLLFVPGDRPERFAKAAASGADALILDLEDSVVAAAKAQARANVAAWLADAPPLPVFVRINPLAGADGGMLDADLAALGGHAFGVVLPKAEGAASVRTLAAALGGSALRILPIVTETPRALFRMDDYAEVADRLVGLTWGAEDLSSAVGAVGPRDEAGGYRPPYDLARSLTLFAAHAAGVAAIETVYPDLADLAGLEAYAARGRFDGFSGMMALHPKQIAPIHAGFTPTAAEIAHARAVIAALAAGDGRGAARRAHDRRTPPRRRRTSARGGRRAVAPTPCPSPRAWPASAPCRRAVRWLSESRRGRHP